MMDRRRFGHIAAGAMLAWPVTTRAQQPAKVIGILDPGVPHIFDAFIGGMRDLGYVDGQNITYVRKSAQGRAEAVPALATELVNLKVDVITTVAPLPAYLPVLNGSSFERKVFASSGTRSSCWVA